MYPRSRLGGFTALAGLLLISVPSADTPATPRFTSGGLPATSAAKAGPRGRAGGARCLGFKGLDRLNPAAQVKEGRFRAVGLPPARVAGGPHGTDVDWAADPYRNTSWRLWLHSLAWLGGPIKEYERSGDRAALEQAIGIARDWLADHGSERHMDTGERRAAEEAAKFRLATLSCLRGHVTGRWLDTAISEHAEWVARHWSGPWNHGTDESLIVLSAACRVGRDDLAATAYRRLLSTALHPPGAARPGIDAEGADNEQSTHYSIYNRSRWRLAITVMRDCHRPVPGELRRRLKRMDEFIAFQSTPAGGMLQIGESKAATVSDIARMGNGPLRYAATKGREGTKPSTRARVYQAGYVVGRSGWGDGDRPYEREMAYTARFGPGRFAHGQEDHMALTFFAQGRDILVPSGHIGYSNPGWRKWLKSPNAHNTVVVRNAPFRDGTDTELTGHRFAKGGDFFRFTDTAFGGTRRTRSVLAASDPDALLVLDHVRSDTSRRVEQLWHLPPDFAATTANGGSDAVATAGSTRVHFLRLHIPQDPGRTERGQAFVVKGDDPRGQGWVAPTLRTMIPAPVVVLPARGGDVRMLTLIAPVDWRQQPAAKVTQRRPDGSYRVEATISGRRLVAVVSRDGTLRRLS
ncbi:hypothetical protein Acsp03_71730 [Actinomadura sp. NBRC 104412]|nr:hypothetical protein Acsp03_71730 [Actinomadura sp. NBRC 104412]